MCIDTSKIQLWMNEHKIEITYFFYDFYNWARIQKFNITTFRINVCFWCDLESFDKF